MEVDGQPTRQTRLVTVAGVLGPNAPKWLLTFRVLLDERSGGSLNGLGSYLSLNETSRE